MFGIMLWLRKLSITTCVFFSRFIKLLLGSSKPHEDTLNIGFSDMVSLMSDMRMSTRSQFSLLSRPFVTGYKLTLRLRDYSTHNVMLEMILHLIVHILILMWENELCLKSFYALLQTPLRFY